jgi:integrase
MKQRKRQIPETVQVGNVVVKVYPHRRHIEGREQPYLNWQVADYTTGRRRLIQFADHTAAIREAERIARQTSTGQVEAAMMTNADAQSYGRAVALIKPTGDTLETACELYAKAVAILGTGPKLEEAARAYVQRDTLPAKTVQEVIDEMIAEKRRKGREEETIRELRGRLGKFAQDFHCPIASITRGDIQQWLDGLKASQRTVVNCRGKLGVLFNWAMRREYILSNPVQNTERPECLHGKVEIYTPPELLKLIAAASKDFLPCLVIGGFAGLRSSEIQRLQWEDVNLARGHIVASAKKRGTPSRRIVPIQPNLAQWLVPYAGRTGRIWRATMLDFHNARRDTAETAGVHWKRNGLRHSFISYRLAALQNVAQVSLEAGNSPAVVHTSYKELVSPEDATAWFSIAPTP